MYLQIFPAYVLQWGQSWFVVKMADDMTKRFTQSFVCWWKSTGFLVSVYDIRSWTGYTLPGASERSRPKLYPAVIRTLFNTIFISNDANNLGQWIYCPINK